MLNRNLCVIGLVAGIASASQGAIVTYWLDGHSGTSTDSHAGFTGSITWSYTSGSHATVTVHLTNTSTQTEYITGFGAGLHSSNINPSMTNGATNFSELTGSGLQFGQFGTYDFGSGVSGSSGGSYSSSGDGSCGGGSSGSPSDGIAVGHSASWTFSMSANSSTLAAVHNASVYNGSNPWDFIVKLSSTSSGEQSDGGGGSSGTKKVDYITSGFLGSPIPGPGALGVLALAGVFSRRRRA